MNNEAKQTPKELPLKIIELRKIVAEARRRFDLQGDELIELARGCVVDMLVEGALPVARNGEDGNEWIVQRQYGSRADEIAENIVREWLTNGVGDEHLAGLGFALPPSALEVDEDDYTPGSPKVRRWADLYQRVVETLSEYGQEDTHLPGDYWVHDDYWGYPQVKIILANLALLKTPLVTRLKALLSDFPDHEIIVAIDGEKHWPDMGLTIRAHEIIDGLQRRYFPAEYRSIAFEGSRPGSERD